MWIIKNCLYHSKACIYNSIYKANKDMKLFLSNYMLQSSFKNKFVPQRTSENQSECQNIKSLLVEIQILIVFYALTW